MAEDIDTDHPSAEGIDTSNSAMVSFVGDRVILYNPLRAMTPDRALVHAAWLVAMAEPHTALTFADAYKAVCAT